MRKSFGVFILGIFLLINMLAVHSVSAWTGVEGMAIDANSDPWIHGGEVYIVNNSTGDIEGTGTLNPDGSFTVLYGTDGIACGCVNVITPGPPSPGTDLSVYILYNDGGGGQPGTGQSDYTEALINENFNVGFVSTGTGPTAISFSYLEATSTPTSPYILITLLAFGLSATSYILLRRYQSAY